MGIGIILRGSGFAFRKSLTTLTQQKVFGAVFATPSIITPLFLGAMAWGKRLLTDTSPSAWGLGARPP